MNHFFFAVEEEKQESTGEGADEHIGDCLRMLCIHSLRTLGSQIPLLIDISIKEMSSPEEEERAREQESYCRV